MNVAKRLLPLAAGAALLGTSACRDTPTAAPSPQQASSSVQSDQSVARAIALALSAPELRVRVLEDMRDSPLPQHALALGEYLRTERGRPLAVAAAAATHTSLVAFTATVEHLPAQRLYMPRPLDRARWSGEGSVVVFAWKGLAATDPSSAVNGFRVDGTPVHIGVDVAVTYPLLAIEPVEARSATDARGPEVRTHDAVRTISTREEEAANVFVPRSLHPLVSCDDNPDQSGCSGSGAMTTAGIQLPYGWSFVNCTGVITADVDHDGIDDPCEERIAAEFRPYLQLSARGDDWSRETYYAVRKTGNYRSFAIMYLLGYHTDRDHVGDSEFLQVEVKDVGVASWEVRYATLSAHWGTLASNTGTWSYTDLQYPDHLAARPLIWVAEGKHANYKTQNQCDSGAYWFDTCDGNTIRQDVVLQPNGNVGGSGYHMRDCVPSAFGLAGTECFWTNDKFRGWYAGVDGATPYHDVLWSYGY